MNYLEILDKINLQGEIKEKVTSLLKENKEKYLSFANDLTCFDKAEETFNNLLEIYKEDKENINILAIYTLSMELIYLKYREINIKDNIFIDTMKCFTRFIDECYEKNGKYYFDRAFWTYRQTCMKIFRIGQLEYELYDYDNYKCISVHIPSDAILTKENIDCSLKEMKEFISQYFVDFVDKEVTCHTWLLSPKLKEVLGADSRILIFQNYFDIVGFNEEAKDVFEWVFKTNYDTKIEDLKENTSLQRNIKKMLLSGQNIGCATGILKKNEF